MRLDSKDSLLISRSWMAPHDWEIDKLSTWCSCMQLHLLAHKQNIAQATPQSHAFIEHGRT